MNLGDVLGGGSDADALIDLSAREAGALGRSYSFTELDAAVQNVAARMSFENGAHCGLLAANSASFVATWFALMRRGAIAVPINTKFPDATVAYITQDASLTSVYVDAEHAAKLPTTVQAMGLPPLQTGERFVSHAPAHGELGMVLYTSGSTGRPKGVLLSHDSQWAMVAPMAKTLAGLCGIVAAPLYHMNGQLFLMALLAGRGKVVLMPKFDARRYLQAIAEHKVNVLTGVPTMLTLMLKEHDLMESLDLSSVIAIQVGSAPLSETLIDQVQARFPNARISNGYGTTEAGALMFGAHPDGIPVPSLALGYPQRHVKVRLVGGSDNEGVLEVLTPAAMNGYLNLPEKTAEKMTRDGWISTGDLMRRDEHGFFYFVGRDDDMFNCGGENIFPGEVERILESDPRIAECCVVPVADEIKGHKPVAFVVLAQGARVNEAELKAVVLSQAPAYMHPRSVYFLEVMPLAGTNKIDRKVLAALAAESAAADGH